MGFPESCPPPDESNPVESHQIKTTQPVKPAVDYGYEMIDRYLRNNLDDDDYAEYSAALDSVMSPPIAQPVQPADNVIDLIRAYGDAKANDATHRDKYTVVIVRELFDELVAAISTKETP